MTISLLIGTRPECIKMAPIIWQLQKRKIPFEIVNSHQHYDANLMNVFYKDLNLPPESLIGHSIISKNSKLILVQGDTSSVFDYTFDSKLKQIPVAHVEAGLRCGNISGSIPEELYRIAVDHVADLHFCTTQIAVNNLIKEGIQRPILTGNTIVESLEYIKSKVKPVKKGKFALVTIHRRENITNLENLSIILNQLKTLSKTTKIIFPIHPHTANIIQENFYDQLKMDMFCPPMDYKEFIAHLMACQYVISDSGGIGEESCILRKPCVIVRQETERPETLSLNAVICSPKNINKNTSLVLNRLMDYQHPYGEKASEKIVDKILNFLGENK